LDGGIQINSEDDMAEERGATIIGDRVEARLDSIENRLSRIEGLLEGFRMAFDQMDKRLTELSTQMDRRFSTIQWVMGLLVALQVLVLGKLFLK
jgi:hypothetical protein